MKKQNININQDYKYGFITDIENIRAPKGLSEQSIKFKIGRASCRERV